MLRKQRKMLRRENGEINSVDFLEEACLMFRKKEDVSETKHSCLRGIQSYKEMRFPKGKYFYKYIMITMGNIY